MAGFDPARLDVGGFLGGALDNQTIKAILIWQVLGQVFSAALAPLAAEIQQQVFKQFPELQLSLAEAVDGAVKSHLTAEQAAAEARLSGINQERFNTLLANAGEPPGLEFLAEAWRRGFIPREGAGAAEVSLEQGIRESRLKNKWIAVVEEMQFRLAPVATVIEGWLRAQISETEARDLLRKAGVDEATATLMYKSAGRPPGPMELIELMRRGVIPEAGEGGDTLSLRQGYLETDLKNKWYEPWRALAEYLPPPRTVTALLRAGTLTDAEALVEFKKAGLSEHLAGVYVANAHHERTHATRELTKGDLLQLYSEGVLSRAEVLADLEKLGYAGAVAEFEVEAADFRRVKGLIDRAVGRLHTLYVGHKIGKDVVVAAFTELAVATEQQARLMQVWDLERADNVRVLTPAEVVHAVKLGMLDEPGALARLQLDGYSEHDAWLRLGVGLGATPATAEPSQ